MIKMPPKPPIDVMRPDPWVPTLGSGTAAGALQDGSDRFKSTAVKLSDAVRNHAPGRQRSVLERMQQKVREKVQVVHFPTPTAERLQSELEICESKISDIEKERRDLEAFQQATLELLRWQKAGLAMQRPTSSNMHHLLDAMAEKRVRLLFREAAGMSQEEFGHGHLVGQGTHAFLVEHDWAGVFEKAADFAGDDFRLPYDSMCFEFRISGKNICAMITSNGERKIMVPFVDSDHGWVLPKYAYIQTGAEAWRPTPKNFKPGDTDEYEPLRALICGQIRAACISLEAKATVTEVIRASHKLNRSREKRGRAPVADYHVIKLAHRHRALPREDAGDGEPWARKRLHFRRGHDRHYPTYKIWIAWTLVGDPDLGFVDKHYRL